MPPAPVIRLVHDDDALAIVDKINVALRTIGYALKDDEQEHDGYCLYRLVPLTDPAT